MKSIVFTGPGSAEIVEEAVPAPKAGEVRVRLVRSCISSGTERANVAGVPDCGTGIFSSSEKVTWPRRSGYSSSGVVDAVGEGVTAFRAGDRVATSWSSHSEFVCLPASQVYSVPDGVSFEDAAWTHISTFPMAALRKCRLEIGEGALVMGQGVLGQLAVKLLRAAGATPVLAADPDPARRARALALGADAALDPTAADFVAQAKGLCRGERAVMRAMVPTDGPGVVLEVTGVGAALDQALDAVAPYARVALLGCTRNSNFTIDYYHKVHGRGVTLVGAHTLARAASESAPGWWTERDDALAFLRLLALGRVTLEGFVEEVRKPADCGEVYGRLVRGGAFPCVQFDWT